MNSNPQQTLLLSQVPCLGTEVKGKSTTNAYHEVKTYLNCRLDDEDAILSAFARFIAGIADTTQPYFHAQLPGGGWLVNCESAFAATADSKPNSLELRKQDVQGLQGDYFCISVSKGGIAAGVSQPSGALHLTVAPDGDVSAAGLTLRLRISHGPLDAATHLLKLIASLLKLSSPQPTLLSRFNVGIGLESQGQLGLGQSINQLLTSGIGGDDASLVQTAFERQVQSRPDNILIEYMYRDEESSLECSQHLTYKDVDVRATALAEQLVEIERYADWQPMIEQQRAVPVLLPTCPELIIAILGILKAGYAACPLALDRPAESLQEVLDDLNAVPVIGLGKNPLPMAKRGSNNSRQSSSGTFIWIDMDNVSGWRTGRISTASIPRPLSAPAASDVAYVIFTSGSTGKPKGVLVPHSAMVASISNFARRVAHLPTGPRLRWFIMNLPSFDAYQLDVLHVILRGGTLCMAERNLVLTDVEGTIDRLRATATTTVSSLAVILRPEKVPTLQTIVAGGEMLHQQVVDNFGQRDAPARGKKRGQQTRHLINGYGPTETAIVVATEDISVTTRGSIIGSALPSAIIVIIDPQSESAQELPAGVAGELAIGGPQLSRGYLNRPVETAQAFVTHDILGRLYRTGDKARVVWTGDGERKIEILGRLTLDQVKINGRRMELGEVESCLLNVAQVREAAVVVVQNSMLAAFLVLRQDGGGDAVKLACKQQASSQLAPWMCPASYHVVSSLPRTPNDKVDRRKLTRSMEEMGVVKDEQPPLPQAPLPQAPLPQTHHPNKILNGDSLADENNGISRTRALNGNETPMKVSALNGIERIEHTEPSQPAAAAEPRTSFISSSTQPGKSTEETAVDLVYKGLAAAVGEGVRSHPQETPISNIGLDSIRAMTFLRTLRANGVTGLAILDVLSAGNISDVITKLRTVLIQESLNGVFGSERPTSVAGTARNSMSPSDAGGVRDATATKGHDASEYTAGDRLSKIMTPDATPPDGNSVASLTENLKSIPLDDEDAIYELSPQAKIWHYNYHCRGTCAQALNLREQDIEQVLPATGIQMRLLHLATDPTYSDPQRYQGKPQVDHVVYRVPPGMDAARLQRAIETVVSRHEIFRTLFAPTKHPLAEFAQVVLVADSPRAALQTRTLYVEGPGDDNGAEWKQKLAVAQEDAERSLALDTPSIRVAYVQSLDERRCVVVFSLFHAVYDGVAFRLLRAAVAAEYAGAELAGGGLLPFRAAVERHLEADWLETILFLMSRYANVPAFRTGRLRPRASLTREYDDLHYRLYPSVSHMRRFSIRSRVTLDDLMGRTRSSGLPMSGQAVAQAAWAKMLSQTQRAGSPQADAQGGAPTYVEFTTAVHGRYSDEARRTMGPLLAGLPMMVPISDIRAQSRTNRDVCNALAVQHQQLLRHMAMPCPNVEMAQVGMDRADTGLVLQIHDLEDEDGGDARTRLPDLPLFHHDQNVLPPYKPLDTGFVIMVEVWPGVAGGDDNLTLICSYNSQRPGYDFLSRSWVLSAVVSFDEAMADILENPESSFCAGPVLVNGHE
ncbi:AMP-dependent synthetase/ligase [Cordyceps fumosorosea ARSEF 2679]|uniref:AMP-dependent synthetase/ligase n=1 Tax=Cordyceps fumosorosea (strain ARSEF 2679) TaxID=1081104 RepID=A0A162I760_CORFA|nr:AMP-dependent synthetase/ligase [Cordyceps fumosorosea ARSEF 2679]OAA53205.1 AMP-dependent synthetase/ligase [Cordyceps fumosorosea ARSEF 2679]